MIRPSENVFAVQQYISAIFRHKKKLILFNAVVLAATICVILFWPRQYRSAAKIWIKIGRENSRLDPTVATGETISIQETDREDEIKSVLDVIASRGVVAKVVDVLSPEVVLGEKSLNADDEDKAMHPVVEALKSYIGGAINIIKQIDPVSTREEAIQEVVENIAVDSQRKSNVVSISYDAKTPGLAQAVVGEMISQYRLEHARIHTTSGSRSFFEEQRTRLNSEVNEKAQLLRKVKDINGLTSVEGQRRMLEDQMMKVQQSNMDALQNVARSAAQIAKLKSLLASEPESIQSEQSSVPNTGRDMIRSQLYTLQVQRMELEAKMNDHPRIDAIKQQEAEAREELAKRNEATRSETKKSINPIHQELAMNLTTEEAKMAGHQAVLKTLQSQREMIAKNIETLNDSDVMIASLQRDLDLAIINFQNYDSSLEDARIDEALDSRAISNISVAQQPTFEEKPLSPSKVLVALLGMMGMIFGTIALAIIFEMLDQTYQHPAQATAESDPASRKPELAGQPQYR